MRRNPTASATLAITAFIATTLGSAAPASAQQLVERAAAARTASAPDSAAYLERSLREARTLLRYDLGLAQQRTTACVELAQRRGDNAALAIAYALRARIAVQTTGPLAANEALDAANAVLPADAAATARCQVLLAEAVVQFTLDKPLECVATLRRAIDLSERSGDVGTQLRTNIFALKVIGKSEHAVQETARLHELAQQVGEPGLIFATQLFHTMANEKAGDLPEPEPEYDALLARAAELGDRATESFLALNRAAHHASNDLQRALELVDRAVRAASLLGGKEMLAVAHELRSRVLMALDRPEASRAAAQSAVDLLEGTGMLLRHQQALTTAAYLASLRGESALARRFAAQNAEVDRELRKRAGVGQRARLWKELTQLQQGLRRELDVSRQTAAAYAAQFDRTLVLGSAALAAVLLVGATLLFQKQRRLRRANGELKQAIAASEQLQEERAALTANLQQLERLESIGLLAGGFAHDFNNILVAIQGNSHLLLTDEPAADRKQMLQEILQASDRAAGLCTDILNYANKTPTPMQPTDLRGVVAGIVPLAKAGFGAGVEVSLALGDTPQVANVDSVQIEQVFLNILVNAGEAVAESGHVHVSIDRRRIDGRPPTGDWFGEFPGEPRECVAVTFVDNGQGMSQETVRRIFDPFFSTRFAGRGLGLAASFGILRRHGGVCEVRSEIGRGTHFTVYLPVGEAPEDGERALQEEPAVVLQPHPPQRPAVDSARAGILVVDDEPDVCGVAARLFERHGHAVFTAHSAAEALDVLESNADRVGLALLDVTMPELDGPSLAYHLRNKSPDLPVVLMTGHVESAVRSDDLDVPVVTKPFDFARLTAVVRDELATRT